MKITRKIKTKIIISCCLLVSIVLLLVFLLRTYKVNYCVNGQVIDTYEAKLFERKPISEELEGHLYDPTAYDSNGIVVESIYAFDFYERENHIESLDDYFVWHDTTINLVPADKIYYMKKDGVNQVTGRVDTMEELNAIDTPDDGKRKFSEWTYYGEKRFAGLKNYGIDSIRIGSFYTASYECLVTLNVFDEIYENYYSSYGQVLEMPEYKEGYALLGWMDENNTDYVSEVDGMLEFKEDLKFHDFSQVLDQDIRLYACVVECEGVRLIHRNGYINTDVKEVSVVKDAKLDFNMNTYLLLSPTGKRVMMAGYGKYSGCVFTVEDESIAYVEDNIVIGKSVGKTILTIHFGNYHVSLPLIVEDSL